MRNFRWPGEFLAGIASASTHAHLGAPVAQGEFPVVVFSHGYWSYPRQNTALMEAIAAQGYVALSLAHPGDAADVPTDNGVLATTPYDRTKAPDNKQLDAFWSGPTDSSRRKAFAGFWRALEGGRLIHSLERWRADILRLTDAVANRSSDIPPDLALASDRGRFAFVGMSFGGSTSASACERDKRCRAVVNLDGFEFDRKLYNHRLRAPMLLIQSDWQVYPNAGPPGRCSTVYDYAYRQWSDRGFEASVYRFLLPGTRHMGLTDLILAPRDAVRDRIVGTAEGAGVVNAVNSIIVAFLDKNLKSRNVNIAAAAARYPSLERHLPFEKPDACRRGGKR